MNTIKPASCIYTYLPPCYIVIHRCFSFRLHYHAILVILKALVNLYSHLTACEILNYWQKGFNSAFMVVVKNFLNLLFYICQKWTFVSYVFRPDRSTYTTWPHFMTVIFSNQTDSHMTLRETWLYSKCKYVDIFRRVTVAQCVKMTFTFWGRWWWWKSTCLKDSYLEIGINDLFKKT